MTRPRIDGDPRVIDAEIRNQQAYLTTNLAQQASRAAKTEKQAQEEAALLRSLTPAEAAKRIEQTRATEAARDAQQAEQRRAALNDRSQHRTTRAKRRPTMDVACERRQYSPLPALSG